MPVETLIEPDELIALFTGVEHEDGGWITAPSFNVRLATRIAKELCPMSETSLRKAMYGNRACDDIDPEALKVIAEAYAEYRKHRDLQVAGRGL